MPTFGQLVRRNGRYWPTKDAFVELDRRVAWGAFDRRTDALGHALRASGIAPGDRVAILASDCIEVAETFIACAKIGAIRVGLNPRLAPPEIAALIVDSAPKMLFVQGACRGLLPATIATREAAPHLVGFGAGHGLETD